MSEIEQEQQPEPGPANPDDLDADFEQAANIILGREDPPAREPEAPVAVEPDDAGEAPQGGVYDDNGRLRDAQTGSFTTAEALLEKYGMSSLDEFAARYEDNNRKVGSMANEVGEARRELDEWRKFGQQYQQNLQQQPQQPRMMGEEELNAWDEYTVENPLEAAQRAMQSGDPMLYERTIDTWYAEDPKAATRFETTIALHRQQQQFEQQMKPMMQPLQDQYQNQALGQAVGSVKGMYPDFDQVIGNEALLQNAVDYLGGDNFVKALNEAPSAQEKAEGLNILYLVARGISNTVGQQQTPGPPAQNIAGRIQGQLASPSQIPQGGTNTVQGALTNLWEQGLASYEG